MFDNGNGTKNTDELPKEIKIGSDAGLVGSEKLSDDFAKARRTIQSHFYKQTYKINSVNHECLFEDDDICNEYRIDWDREVNTLVTSCVNSDKCAINSQVMVKGAGNGLGTRTGKFTWKIVIDAGLTARKLISFSYIYSHVGWSYEDCKRAVLRSIYVVSLPMNLVVVSGFFCVFGSSICSFLFEIVLRILRCPKNQAQFCTRFCFCCPIVLFCIVVYLLAFLML